MKKVAVVLFNLGGPDNKEAIKPFLFNLFNDRAIIDLPNPLRFLLAKFISFRRSKIAAGIYDLIGGKSPIAELTNNQAESLEKELSYYGGADFKVFVAMRYWHPRAKDVALEVKGYDPDEAILLPLYPQFSTTTSKSSAAEFRKVADEIGLDCVMKDVCCYPVEDKFLKSHIALLEREIVKVKKDGHGGDYRVLFSAHGLPQKIVYGRGDPYVLQVNLTARFIARRLGLSKEDYAVCYQSKVGRMKWVSPSADSEILRACVDGKAVVVAPIAFVSEHSETLVELDIEYKEMAENRGVKGYYRVPALGCDGYFIDALRDICVRSFESDAKCSGGFMGERICGREYRACPNQNFGEICSDFADEDDGKRADGSGYGGGNGGDDGSAGEEDSGRRKESRDVA